MDSIRLFFRIYLNPAAAMSDIIVQGSWVYAAIAVLVVAGAFYATVNVQLNDAYRIKSFQEFYQMPSPDNDDDAAQQAQFDLANAAYQAEMAQRARIPVVGDRFYLFFSTDPTRFYYPLLLLSIFYIPAAIMLMCMFGGIGSFGLVIRRDYGALSVCTLYAWAAAHLPFAIVGIASSAVTEPRIFLALWAASGVLFGVFMVFAFRTVFGANYGVVMLVVGLAWLSMSLGLYIFHYVSPFLFSPFLLFYAIIYLGGSIGGEVRGLGNAFRQKQNFKRFLHSATVNPQDADAHVQLGLIYLQRRRDAKSFEHFEKALEIDKTEIDANYEMGKLIRSKGQLQKALDHFSVVIEQDDKHALSEIWREIGVTYLARACSTTQEMLLISLSIAGPAIPKVCIISGRFSSNWANTTGRRKCSKRVSITHARRRILDEQRSENGAGSRKKNYKILHFSVGNSAAIHATVPPVTL